MRPARIALAAAVTCHALLLVGIAQPAEAQQAQGIVRRFGVTIDSATAAAVDRGDALVRVQPTAESRDVVITGIVRVAVSREAYMEGVQRFASWLRTGTRMRIGIFDQPATLANVASLTISRDDARRIEDCRPGSCTTKMSAAEMQQVQASVDWSGNDVPAKVSMLARQRFVDHVEAYRRSGNAAMPTYDDRPTVRASDAFAAVLVQSTVLAQSVPELAAYLRDVPRNRPAGATDVIYWAEDAGARVKPVLSLAHAVIWSPPQLAGTSLVVQKQLHANHYFEAALEVVSVTERVVAIGGAPSSYLAIERRLRFDNLPRGGFLNIRGRAVNGLRDRLLADLRREQAALATGLPR